MTEAVAKKFERIHDLKIIGLRTPADILDADSPADIAALRETGAHISQDDLRNVKHISTTGFLGNFSQVLAILPRLHSLRRLQLPDHTSDVDLTMIAAIKTIRSLDLSRAPVTDAGLKQLAGLTDLRELSLEGCRTLPMPGWRASVA